MDTQVNLPASAHGRVYVGERSEGAKYPTVMIDDDQGVRPLPICPHHAGTKLDWAADRGAAKELARAIASDLTGITSPSLLCALQGAYASLADTLFACQPQDSLRITADEAWAALTARIHPAVLRRLQLEQAEATLVSRALQRRVEAPDLAAFADAFEALEALDSGWGTPATRFAFRMFGEDRRRPVAA